MAIFESNDRTMLLGFDDHAEPRWQMVPLSGFRDVRLSPVAGCTVFNMNPELADIEDKSLSSSSSVCRIRGKNAGSGTLLAVHAQGSSTLEYTVMHKKKIKVYFHFVHDSAGHRPSRPPADVKMLLDGANFILGHQANIWLEFTGVNPYLYVNRDLGAKVCMLNSVDSIYKPLDTRDALKPYDVPGAFNVFLVWSAALGLLQCFSVPGAGAIRAGTATECVLGDTARADTLAHEVGHWLGLEHDDYHGDALMAPGTVRSGTKMTKLGSIKANHKI